ncbi:uncharacterized protein C8Q71DRAFT_723933 [Rhodofomes roseus]|uniref:Uncharacterized protein n=1 Tax=Rhodofomes roseus TaxID=34475 RepID=A0ABQ8KEY6_9APHY|nr:uncharacterized protein C8Q71DRAFT_723933 [Rhodofomes roseus]KAH9836063.1 hypothetical protein C8Q71DRAFT_723933 [Rhodofomes roseus]
MHTSEHDYLFKLLIGDSGVGKPEGHSTCQAPPFVKIISHVASDKRSEVSATVRSAPARTTATVDVEMKRSNVGGISSASSIRLWWLTFSYPFLSPIPFRQQPTPHSSKVCQPEARNYPPSPAPALPKDKDRPHHARSASPVRQEHEIVLQQAGGTPPGVGPTAMVSWLH